MESYRRDYGAIEADTRQLAKDFMFVWSVFEAEIFNSRVIRVSDLEEKVDAWYEVDQLEGLSINAEWEYFKERYQGQGNNHFGRLGLRDGRRLVSETVNHHDPQLIDRVKSTLIIVYKPRNKMIHGEKWAYNLRGQQGNFSMSISVVKLLLEYDRALG